MSAASCRFTRIFLIRHGEVESPGGVFYGQQDVPLSRQGREQTRLAARNLSGVAIRAVIASDLSRCRALAREISSIHTVEPIITPELREVDFGEWTGLTWQEIERGYPGEFTRRMANLATYRPPGGESLEDVRERVMPVIIKLAQDYTGDAVAVAAHGGINRVILSSLLEMPLQNMFSIDQGFCCTNIIDIFSDGPVVLRALNIPPYPVLLPQSSPAFPLEW